MWEGSRGVVGVTDRVKLDWQVPTAVWERFREYVEDRYGSLEGHLGREAEAAMAEYCNEDEYAPIEEKIDRLLEAAGYTPDRHCGEKNTVEKQTTTRASIRVHYEIKAEFRQFVAGSHGTYGESFARALDAYVGGGRAARLKRKLDRVVDDAERMLAEITSDDTTEMSVTERRTVDIALRLGNSFTEDELREAIDDALGCPTEPTVDRYRERVTDHLDVEPHPVNSALWIPREQAEEMASENVPEEVRKPPERLDREERIRRVRHAVTHEAFRRGSGKAAVSLDDIRTAVLDGTVSRSTVRSYCRAVAEHSGYTVKQSSSGTTKLHADAHGMDDGAFNRRVLDHRDDPDAGALLDSANQAVAGFDRPPSRGSTAD